MLSFVLNLLEDRFLTTLSSQSSTGSTHLQLPTPPEVVSEQLTGANTLSEQDTTSSSEGTVQFWSCIRYCIRKCMRSTSKMANMVTLWSTTLLPNVQCRVCGQTELISVSDVFDGHSLGSTDSQVKEKSTMKAILANLLPGNNYNPIPFPL